MSCRLGGGLLARWMQAARAVAASRAGWLGCQVAVRIRSMMLYSVTGCRAGATTAHRDAWNDRSQSQHATERAAAPLPFAKSAYSSMHDVSAREVKNGRGVGGQQQQAAEPWVRAGASGLLHSTSLLRRSLRTCGEGRPHHQSRFGSLTVSFGRRGLAVVWWLFCWLFWSIAPVAEERGFAEVPS